MSSRFCLILGLLVIATQPASAEKRWSIQSVDIAARVDSAGYMTIEEKRAYKFDGKFSYAYYDLALDGLLDVDHIQVLEDGAPYQLNDERTPGTFFIERDSKKIHLRWQFRGEARHASGDVRVFTLRFRVLGAVRVHRDVAELYYKFVGTGWDRASEKVHVTIQFPPEIRRDELRAWAHGPLHGEIEIRPGNLVAMAVDHLPRRQFWEARVIFPAQYLSAAAPALRDDREAAPGILAQETRWAEEANRQREEAVAHRQWQEANRAEYFSWLWFGLAAGILVFLFMYQRFGRSLRNPEKRINSEPPIEMPPAIANYTWQSHQLNGGALLATLFDLARRNFLRLQQKSETTTRLGFSSTKQEVDIIFDEDKIRHNAAELLPYERELLAFLQTDLAQNRRQLGLEEIRKQATKFRRFFSRWKKAVALQAGKPKLYEADSVRGSIITFSVWLILNAANVFAIHAMGDAAIPLAIVSLCLSPFAFFILRYTPEHARKLDRLQTFRDYLKRFPKTPPQHSANWQQVDQLLIYAVALGFTGAQIKPLLQALERERADGAFAWFLYTGSSSSTGLSSTIASMVDAVGSTMSSASGAGGGASAGGGGGAGGSGGGAG
ncbi:MAG: DUF2207 domain-containing protein [candidate division KSB1 bacterium]|nr:DUF2207 domain-containing protein [candidate division KSB1 bacterium]MDZ7365768.1 DUF2207 domain-containing protein [candidate division KSB1 bacterium]MDZ7403753.1 DUF2207 domain-containing protein [candidate division KSB1 bacterium]